MPDDLFLKIISREIPANIVYETDTIIAFEDIHPQAPVHILIVPKEYFRTLNDIDKDHINVLGEMMTAAQVIAREQGIAEDGYRVIVNPACQVVQPPRTGQAGLKSCVQYCIALLQTLKCCRTG